MFNNEMTPVEVAKVLMSIGVRPIALKEKSKVPAQGCKWQHQKPDLDLIKKTGNLGVSGLIDIDLDNPIARQLAPMFLPKTGLIFGRESSQPSHIMYKPIEKESLFRYKKFIWQKGTLVEYRAPSQGCLTTFPPSIHNGGEQLFFIKGSGPSQVPEKDIFEGVNRLAAATVMALNWAEGSRQDATMALTGALCYAEWKKEEIEIFVECVLKGAGDQDEIQMRRKAISGTLEKYDRGEKVTGFTTLKEIMGGEVIDKVKSWLNVSGIEGKSGDIIMQDKATYVAKITPKGQFTMEKIATFEMKPVKAIEVEGKGEYLTMEFSSHEGKVTLECPPTIWVSAQKFKQFLAEKGNASLAYLGSEGQLQALKYHISTMMGGVTRIKGVTVLGFHGDKFVSYDGALTSEGMRQDTVVINPYKVETDLLTREAIRDFGEIRELIVDFNIPVITHAVMGWVSACYYKTLFHDFKDVPGFPLMLCEGVAGSGKTQTLELIASIFGMSNKFVSISQVTPFIMAVGPGASNFIPVIYEECKFSRMSERKRNEISSLGRDTYTRAMAQKGTKSLSHIDYPREAPILIAGESVFSEAAMMERVIQCSFGRQSSYGYERNFKRLKNMDLGGLGRALLEKRLRTPEETIKGIYDEEYQDVDKCLEARVRNNAAIVRTGLRVLGDMIGRDLNLDHVDSSLALSTMEEPGRKEQKSEIGKTLEAMGRMAESIGEAELDFMYKDFPLIREIHYKLMSDGTQIALYADACYDVFKAWARKYGYDGDVMDVSSFKRQLSAEPYFTERKPVKMNHRAKKCYVLSLKKLENAGIDLGYNMKNNPA